MKQFQIKRKVIARAFACQLEKNPHATMGNGVIDFSFTDEQYDTLHQAIDRGWICVTGKAADQLVLTAYWLWCETEQRPWVKVTRRRKFCQCDLDMYTTSYNLSEWGLDRVAHLFRQTLRGRRGKVIADVGNWSVCNRIPVEEMEYVASTLFEIGSTDRVSIYPIDPPTKGLAAGDSGGVPESEILR